MSVKVDPSGPRSPQQRVAEQSTQEARSAAVKRQDASPSARPLSVVDRYTASQSAPAAAAPLETAAVVEQRDQIRARRRGRTPGDGPVIGAAPEKTSSVSSYDDDPFAQPSITEAVLRADFKTDAQGKPVGLEGPRVKITEPKSIGQFDQQGDVIPVATNPWTPAKPDAGGNFLFPAETRFPQHQVELDARGQPKLNSDGLQVWKKQDLHLGQTTSFEAVNQVHRSSEEWAGRPIKWGQDGQLAVNTHEFIDLNAFYNPIDRALHLGVVPYRTPDSSQIKMFEMATSWEVVGHEAGHAVHDELKPNKGLVDPGYREWGESFADQLAMWSSLRDPDRVASVLKETGGDLSKPSSLTRIGEAFGALTGQGDNLRDATNTLTVGTTSSEFHDRSQVLSGAAYKIFQGVYADLRKEGLGEAEALQKGGEVMGVLQMRAAEHTPENSMTLEDVGKAYLKADKEYFGGRYNKLITAELQKREIFDTRSVAEWKDHEAKLPAVALAPQNPSRAAAEKMVRDNLEKLAPGREFGLQVQQFHVDSAGQQVVRVQLTSGRGADAKPLDNHGVMVFRKDGSLMDYQQPLPTGLSGGRARELLREAEAAGLDQKGKLSLVPRRDGAFTAQAVQEVKTQRDPHLQVFTLEEPAGQRREYFFKDRIQEHASSGCFRCLLPPGAKVLTPAELLGVQGS